MRNRVLALLIAAAAIAFQGCLFSSKDDGTGVPKGVRRPNAPAPTYKTFDSLVYIRVDSRREGEERFYWMYRDGKLLDQPRFYTSPDGGASYYELLDSVPKPGTYTYTVKYGEHRDTLSDPSKPYAFKYEGPSPSGRVYLEQGSGSDVIEVQHLRGRKHPLRRVIIERKVGADGQVESLDTIETDPNIDFTPLFDTTLDAGDYTAYYRAVGQALDEEWLKPSPWDSLKVSIGPWAYLPQVLLSNHGTDIEVRVNNPLTGLMSVTYYLWRNGRSTKDGAVLVDSMVLSGDMLPLLADLPSKLGTWWYWVEAKDGRGRLSARSNPVSVRFTGRPAGPAIRSLAVGSTYITLEFEPNAGDLGYSVERTLDTTRPAGFAQVDSLLSQPGMLYDRPPKDGYWFYRITSRTANGNSDPGPWARSGYYAYRPLIQPLTANIANRGDKVEASPTFIDGGFTFILFRSGHPAGRDSAAVDTLRSQDFSPVPLVLQDKPALGTWFYQLRGYQNQGLSGDEYRSEWVRVEFTGKPVGPEVVNAIVQTYSVNVQFRTVREAVAYVIERAEEGSPTWTAVDTVQGVQADFHTFNDRPPADGFWQYRVRAFMPDMSLSAPGASKRTNTTWSEASAFSNTLTVNLVNGGTYVEISGVFPEWQYTYYLLRSTQDNFKGGVVVDSLPYGATPATLNDAPEKGTYYYWVERRYAFPGSFPMTILRCMPIKVAFTGIPEIGNLVQEGNSIRLTLPSYPGEDALEVYRSSGNAQDPASYSLVATSTGGFGGPWSDQDLDLTKPSFYHYKLVLIRNGEKLQGSQIRSFYFVPR